MEVHLPCPPLREWLPVLLADVRAVAWNPGAAPRRVRSVLREWPVIASADDELGADAVLIGVSLERPTVPEACLARLRPGTLIIELAVPRRRVVRRLLGLDRRPQTRAFAGQSRALQWLARGCFELEQWETVEPAEIVVTLARLRSG